MRRVSQLYTNQKAGTMMIRDLQGHIPAGTYTLLYDGEGIIDCSMDVDGMRQMEAGRAEIDLKPSTQGNNGLFCTVERTNPANPVRNIRVGPMDHHSKYHRWWNGSECMGVTGRHWTWSSHSWTCRQLFVAHTTAVESIQHP